MHFDVYYFVNENTVGENGTLLDIDNAKYLLNCCNHFIDYIYNIASFFKNANYFFVKMLI